MGIEKASTKVTKNLNEYDFMSLTKSFSSDNNIEILGYSTAPFSEEVRGLLGVHELLTIRISDPKSSKTEKVLTFFMKSSKSWFNGFQRTLYDAEVNFFIHVVPRLHDNCKSEQWAAKCYLVKEDTLVLDDLRGKGYHMGKGQLTDDQLRSAASAVARYHASSMLLEAKLQKPLSEAYPGFFKEKCFSKDDIFNWKFLRCSIKLSGDIARRLSLNPEFVSKGYELLIGRCNSSKGRLKVLNHCDLWKNNLLFKEEGDVTKCLLVDFQTVSYRVYVADLIQLLYINCTREQRESVERECIDVYHRVLSETLRANGYQGRMLAVDEVIEDFEENRIFGLVFAAHLKHVFLFSKRTMKEYTKDEELFNRYSYSDRSDFVFKVMQEDDAYRSMVEDTVVSLIKYMENRQKN